MKVNGIKFSAATLAMISAITAGAARATARAQEPAAPTQQTPEGTSSTWDGVFTEEQAKRGEAVYNETCANCHGEGLQGIDSSPALSGPQFTSNWNDLMLADLFERIRISMPSDRPGTLTRAQVADVLAYMLQANKFPAGTTEVSQELPPLKSIRFVATKPEA
jgi:mono/diheme cytochrome c family protein